MKKRPNQKVATRSELPANAQHTQSAEAVETVFPTLTQPNNTLQAVQMQSTHVSMSDSVATMITIDGMHNEEIRQRFMLMVESRNNHDKEIEKKAQERAEARADRALEAEISLRKETMLLVFIIFLLLVGGFIAAVLSGVPASCLYAFGIFFAAGGVAIFVNILKSKNG